MFTLDWASATDVGRVRQVNEDSLFSSGKLFVVADGMGGHAAGGVASRLVADQFAALDQQDALEASDLADAVAQANAAILAEGHDRPERAGMGTTVTGIGVVEVANRPHWAVFNVGDSRVYRYADGTLTQLTVDHSAVQELIDAGAITEEEARYHSLRHVVTRWLGSDPAPVPAIAIYEAVAGERFMICSDGLTNELRDAEIAQVLEVHADPDGAAAELIIRANGAGGRDNSTVIVLDLIAAD